jgi:hypothetical protein
MQLDNIINKAYKAFCTSRGTFGKTWGLTPKVIYWIYTAVVRPIITYAATATARVKLQTNQADLSKLQRMTCLRITGAMRTAPTAEIEVLLGLPQTHLKAEAEGKARNSYYVAIINENLNPKVLRMHT